LLIVSDLRWRRKCHAVQPCGITKTLSLTVFATTEWPKVGTLLGPSDATASSACLGSEKELLYGHG
jgi:hypothetical protein